MPLYLPFLPRLSTVLSTALVKGCSKSESVKQSTLF
ncbi:hypothetical protein HD_0171 [[Haemophilus] ducreyi 35000HP]|uniref:Uncharacterized protein n=1 Tax=Haemophilus ducreyi (strain 35000HP / ATCC 700724) TaxID=233412 RepID=Q7VPB8_HAEDU|nr:hypothetical protein HD_0171 [[Haemophilus] ducreyi 35000HP]